MAGMGCKVGKFARLDLFLGEAGEVVNVPGNCFGYVGFLGLHLIEGVDEGAIGVNDEGSLFKSFGNLKVREGVRFAHPATFFIDDQKSREGVRGKALGFDLELVVG